MADDEEGGSAKKAVNEKWNALKATLRDINTRTQADTFLASASGIVQEAAALGINIDITAVKESLEAKAQSFAVDQAIDRGQEIRGQVGVEQESIEVIKNRLAINSNIYAEISTKFPEQLKNRNDLFENYDNLSEENKRKFTRQGLTEEERKALENEDKEISERYKLAYQLKEDAEKVKKYHEERIEENNKKLDGVGLATRKIIENENTEHEAVITECKKQIKRVEPVETERDRELDILEKRIKKHPEAAIHGIKEHYKTNEEEYQKLKQQHRHHPALERLENLVKACNEYEKLGLTKNNQEASKLEAIKPPTNKMPIVKDDLKEVSSIKNMVKGWITNFTKDSNNQNKEKTSDKSKSTESAVSKFSKRRKEIDEIIR